jgi:hypothetical protein
MAMDVKVGLKVLGYGFVGLIGICTLLFYLSYCLIFCYMMPKDEIRKRKMSMVD